MYKYYSSLRPVSIGTYPKLGFQGFRNYDWRKPTSAGDAWGEIYYNRELTEKEIRDYDLIPDEENVRRTEHEKR